MDALRPKRLSRGARMNGRYPPGEAIRGSSRSSIALDPHPTAQTDPISPLPSRGGRASSNCIYQFDNMRRYDIISKCHFTNAPISARHAGLRLQTRYPLRYRFRLACFPSRSFTFSIEQRKTAAEQRALPLFFREPFRRKSRISAVNSMPVADKTLQKTARTAGRRRDC